MSKELKGSSEAAGALRSDCTPWAVTILSSLLRCCLLIIVARRTRLLRTAQGLKCVPEELLSTSNADFPTAAGEPARLDSAQEMTESDHAVLLQFAQRRAPAPRTRSPSSA